MPGSPGSGQDQAGRADCKELVGKGIDQKREVKLSRDSGGWLIEEGLGKLWGLGMRLRSGVPNCPQMGIDPGMVARCFLWSVDHAQGL